jgi:hypothetical protein
MSDIILSDKLSKLARDGSIRMEAELIQAARIAKNIETASEWKPIEGAPKDGSEFQAWFTDGIRIDRDMCWEPRARFKDGLLEYWGRIDYDQDGWDSSLNTTWEATHWMPLPTPPKRDA